MNYEEYKKIIQDIIEQEGMDRIKKEFSNGSYELIRELTNSVWVFNKKALERCLAKIIVWVHTMIVYYELEDDFNDKLVQDMTVEILERLKLKEKLKMKVKYTEKTENQKQ